MPISIQETEELHVRCPWCTYSIFCKVTIGSIAFQCSSCHKIFMVSIRLEKVYNAIKIDTSKVC